MEVRFLKISDRVDIKVNSSSVEKNKWYDINSRFRIDKKETYYYGEPLDSIEYEIKDNGLISNKSSLRVNFPTNKNKKPYSSNKNLTINNNEELVFSQLISLNNTVDRIRITSLSNDSDDFMFKDKKVFKGLEIMVYDFKNVKYKSSTGTGNPYQEIGFQAGNINGWSEEYKIKLRINGKAKLEEPTIILADSYESRKSSANLIISNGSVGRKAKFNVDFRTSSQQIYNEVNKGLILINGQEINRNGIFNFEEVLTNKGDFNIKIDIASENIITDGSFYFKVTLESIDNDPSLVSELNNQTIVLSL